ncbi:MAG TPA: hypothetical protein ENI88_12950 [Desulfobulbus sp.]|nr:hypothetical protein [Desulfobulbus sp.]
MAGHRKTLFTLVGIAAGVLFVHPYVMLVHQFTDAGHGVTSAGKDVAILFSAFTPAMLPMTIAFGFFAGACGFLLGLLFERNQRIIRYRYTVQLHRDLTAALNQLLDVLSHYILNSSMVISGHVRRLQKSAREDDRKTLVDIAELARRNEAILKLMQDAEFLRNIDPSDTTYQKIIDLNRRIEERLTG